MFDGDPISTWVFGRDLLAEGLLHPSGADDVKVRTDADQLVLTLDSPSGHAELSTGLAMVEDWLAETLAMVPRHLEYDDLDVECGLLALLEAAS
jgi:hypothetical protein